MRIDFDPLNDTETAMVAAILAIRHGGGAVSVQHVPAPALSTPVTPAMPQMPTTGGDDDGDDGGPVNANAPSVDSSGLPWDERIHSSTKTTKGDGTWTGRRGGPKGAEYDAIVAELRSRTQPAVTYSVPTPMPAPQPMPTMPMTAPMPTPNGAPVPPVAAPMPMPAPVGMAPVAGGVAPAYSPPPMPAPEPAPQPIAAPQPAPAPSGTLDFQQFMQHLSGQMTKRDGAGAPLVHADYLAGITAEISTAFNQQLSAITDIATNPQMITYAMQCMQRDGRWQ